MESIRVQQGLANNPYQWSQFWTGLTAGLLLESLANTPYIWPDTICFA